MPDTNPEEEESLAGALERQGATLLLLLLLLLLRIYRRWPVLTHAISVFNIGGF